MGIFEKSIPKYIVDPINQQVAVRPEDVYVDDIFDPIFNARVKDAMRQKYGGGLYGVVGGYEELLKNTWTGREGILGPGMGLLSTFGRSMEKADDIVLGALTEGIKALSFQGAANPIENIFVNDHDYTGRGLLAATANIGSRLVGAEVGESDFGSAWTIPSLGLELGTDVGILGGTLARNLAPGADKLTAKQLFENLGKSDLKTSIGTVGQLMSDYDDLMAKVALDISAPGLRPAMKGLMNRIAELVKLNSPKAFANHTILTGNPEMRKAAREYYDNDPLSVMFSNVMQEYKQLPPALPPASEEAIALASRTPEQIVTDVTKDAPYRNLEYIKNLLESENYTQIGDKFDVELSNLDAKIREADDAWQKGFAEQSGEALKRMQERNIDISSLGVDTNTAELYDAARPQLNELRQIIYSTVENVNPTYVDDILEKLEDDDKLLEAVASGFFTDNEAANNTILKALRDPTYESRMWFAKANPKYRISPSRFAKLIAYGAEGTSYAHSRLDAIRYAFRSPDHVRFTTEAELEKYLDSDEMRAAYFEFFPKKTRQVDSGEYEGMVRSNFSDYHRFKKLVKDVYFPKPKEGYSKVDVGDYTSNLEELSEFLNNAKLVKTPDWVWQNAPNESSFLEELYRAFDDVREDGRMLGIDQVYLQRLRNEFPSAKKAKLEDIASGIRNDESTSIVKYIQSILSQIAPNVKTDEDLQYIVEPLLDYIQTSPSVSAGKLPIEADYLSRITGIPSKNFLEDPALVKQTLARVSKNRLDASKDTQDAVKEFSETILPKLKMYDSIGFNPTVFEKPYKLSWKDYNEGRALLGYTVRDADGNYILKHPNGYANRLMFQSVWDSKRREFKFPEGSHEFYLTLEDAAMRAKLTQPKYDTPEFKATDIISDIFNYHRTVEATAKPDIAKEAAVAVETAQDAMVKANPEEAATLAYEVPSFAEGTVDDILASVIGEEAVEFAKRGGSPGAFKTIYGKEAWDLYEQIARADAVSSVNSFRKLRATTRTARAKDLLSRVFSLRGRHLTEGGKMSDFRRFVILRQQPYGDIVQGKDFWNELRHSGMLGAVYAKGSKDADAVLDSLTHNANLLKELTGHDVLRVVSEPLGDDKVKIYAQFVNNKKIVTWLNAAADKIEKTNFETVTFSPPKAYTVEDLAFLNQPSMRELAALMDETQELAADQAKYLGFTFNPNEAYTKHAMLRTPDTADWFNQNFYTKTSSEDLDAIVNSISNLDRYRKADHGSFGTTVNTRRFRGDVWMMDNNNVHRFNYDPYEMVTSTLADGTFANLQFQSYVDLFMNDNFKIKGIFNSVDELKEVLYKKLDDGSASGNLRNLELCSMKLDANGKIVGLTKYDKLSDTGLAKALKDENCILVPTNAVSHMDNLLKKDIRMSNKLWTFVNKHFTIPFKFGVLSNPGFLLGNMSDSYLKLATTMSQKYGTTVTEEAKRVAETIKRANEYREDFGTAFDVWRKVSKDNGIMLSPEATVPDIVAMSPKYNEQFLDWLAGRLMVTKTVQDVATGKVETIEIPIPCDISERAKNGASTWVLLQTAQMNSNKLREFADIAELEHATDFDMPTNLWDRVTQGKGKYDKHKPSTWGLFMNNPAMRAMLDASGGWEDVIRTASILDDLEHGYTPEELGILARGEKFTKSDINFRVKLDEAKNTMYNAQFDYERGSDFMESVGKAVPFPVFFLKNFAYWMELFMQNPQYVDNAIDIQEGLWSNRDEEHSKDTFAVEAKGRGAVPIGGDTLPEWFKGFYKPAPLQSMFGAFNLLNDPVGNMQYRVNPLVSGGIAATAKAFPNELTTSLAPTEETKYRPYSTNMYERNIKSSDPNFNPLEYTVHRMNPYERAINTGLRTPHKIREGEAQLSDFVPSVFQPDF